MSNEDESQVKANPTKATLDAEEHEKDLELQRKKRKDSAIPIPNEANEARKRAEDEGSKESQDVSDEYSVAEPREQIEGS